MQDLSLAAPQTPRVLTSEAPPFGRAVATVFEQIKAAEMAELAKAYKITARSATNHTTWGNNGRRPGKPGFCIRCENPAAIEILFHYRDPLSEKWKDIWTAEGGWFTWIVFEKYCGHCAMANFSDVVATASEEVKS